MTPHPQLRPASPADAPALTALADRAYGHYVARMGRKPGPMLTDYAEEIRHGRVQVLEEAGSIIAFLILAPAEGALLLDNVAVAPEAQGRGLGRHLVGLAEAAARAQGLPAVLLYTHVTMTENRAFYARLGYRETHEAVENGLHRVWMRRDLTPAP